MICFFDLYLYMCYAELIRYQSDKAYWSNINRYVFCVIAVEHKRARYTSNGTMIKRGYDLTAQEYEVRAGLRHSVQQPRNRWN